MLLLAFWSDKETVPSSHDASPSDLGWSLGSLSSSTDLSLDPVCLVSGLLAPTAPSGSSPSPIKQLVLVLVPAFLCLASAILPCLLLSIGVPALSAQQRVTVSQPRSWSLKYVCHAGGTSPTVTFRPSCSSAPGVEWVLLQFCCLVGWFLVLFFFPPVPQTQGGKSHGCHTDCGWFFSFRSGWPYADACPGCERAADPAPEWFFHEATAR